MVEAAPASEKDEAVSGETAPVSSLTSSGSVSVGAMVRAGQSQQPRTLSGLTKVQIIHVGTTLYGLQLDGKAKVDILHEQLQSCMEAVVTCDNVACADGPCNTGVHVFTPAQFLPERNKLINGFFPTYSGSNTFVRNGTWAPVRSRRAGTTPRSRATPSRSVTSAAGVGFSARQRTGRTP